MSTFSSCLLEAFDTYVELLSENGSLADEEMMEREHKMRYLLFEECYFDDEEMSRDEILKMAEPLHTCEYDMSQGNPFEKEQGPIVIVKDYDSNKKGLILDGSHRINSSENRNFRTVTVYHKRPDVLD